MVNEYVPFVLKVAAFFFFKYLSWILEALES